MATARRNERVLSIRAQVRDQMTPVLSAIGISLRSLQRVGSMAIRALLAPFRLLGRVIRQLLSPMGMLHTAIGFLAARGMVRFVESTAQMGDEVEKLTQRLGLTAEQLSALRFLSEQTGSSMQAAANGFKLLSRNADDAARGVGTARNDFQRMGIELLNAEGHMRPTMEIFRDIADVFERMPDGATKTATAMRIFGRSGADMIPMLNLGRRGIEELADEAERLGIVMDDAQARLSRDFLDALNEVRSAFRGIRMQVAAEFFPLLIRHLQNATSFLVRVRPVIVAVANSVAQIASGVQDLGRAIVRWFSESTRTDIEGIAEAIKGIGEEVRDVLRGVAAAFGDDEFADRAREALESLAVIARSTGFIVGSAFIDGVVAAFIEGWTLLSNVVVGQWSRLAVRLKKDWIDTEIWFLEMMDRVMGGAGVLQQRMRDLGRERMLLDALQPHSAVEEMRRSMEAFTDETVDIVRESMENIGHEIDGLLPEFQRLAQIGRESAAAMRKLAEDIDHLHDKSDDTKETLEGLTAWLRGFRDAANDSLKSVTNMVDRGRAAFRDLSSSIGSAFGSAFDSIIDGTNSVSQAFRAMVSDILRSMARLFARQAAMAILQPILGAFAKELPDTGILPNALGNVFKNGSLKKFAAGAAIAAGAVTPFAAGGVVNQPTIFPMRSGAGLMGEAGPEAIMPLARNKRGELGVRAEGGPSINVSPTIVIQAIDTRSGVQFISDPKVRRRIADNFADDLIRRRGLRDLVREI